MIITKLIGGLGNQMFQYAAAKALSLHHHTRVLVDVSFLEKETEGIYTQRKFELGAFDRPIEIIEEGTLKAFINKYTLGVNKLKNKIFPTQLQKHLFVEKGHQFQPELFNCSQDAHITGYLQSEKYFSKYENEIRNGFKIKSEFLEDSQHWLNLIQSSNSASIHVRRGDYVESKISNEFHGICSKEYYYEAIEKLNEQHENLTLFVFSDDLDWCKKELEFNQKHFFVESKSHYQDLFLMQNCKHNIIANSSFSWWGAWLNNNPQKKVIAPKNWFQNKDIETKDILPDTWIKL